MYLGNPHLYMTNRHLVWSVPSQQSELPLYQDIFTCQLTCVLGQCWDTHTLCASNPADLVSSCKTVLLPVRLFLTSFSAHKHSRRSAAVVAFRP